MRFDWKDNEQLLREVVSKSLTYTGVLRTLGLNPNGANQYTLRKYLKEFRIDISHFDPRSSRKRKPVLSFEDVSNSKITTASLRRCVLREGKLEYRCAICGLKDWHGAPLSLNLDHIDGDRTHNALENLRWLCPNCDSQQNTFRGRNTKHENKITGV
jgi:hypothetical protein